MTSSAFAPAKVNLYLHVGPPGADGMHPVSSLMVFADVGDSLSREPAPSLRLSVIGPFGEHAGAHDDNLVLRAARALADETGQPAAFHLTLDKQLPVAAGLGGGSSDAGAALRLLAPALGLTEDDAALVKIATRIGADGAACLYARPMIAEGYGERLTPAPLLPELWAVLVNPRVGSSTPAVYREYDRQGAGGLAIRPSLPEAFESVEELASVLAEARNDLEGPAIALNPVIGAVLDLLRDQPESLLARVSGSGATCFCLCAGDIEAEGLVERLERLEPHWWVRRCRLGGPWPK
jgi:4-diphosphocytidyl-2-C-methyl-D-erythritol kinase